MLLRVASVVPDSAEGRWVARTRHRGRPWHVVIEPDLESRTIVVVTAYTVWRRR